MQAATIAFRASFPSPSVLDTFLEDLTSISIVLGGAAGKEENYALTRTQKAVARMNSADFGQLSRALAKSRIWLLALTSAAGVLQTSSQDALADRKLARANAILLDERLPYLAEPAADSEEGARRGTIDNAGLVMDGTALEALEESVCAMTEAISMWSKVQAEQQRPR